MAKKHLSEKEIEEFVGLVYPDGVELAMAMFSERDCILDATRLIKQLQAEEKRLIAGIDEVNNVGVKYRRAIEKAISNKKCIGCKTRHRNDGCGCCECMLGILQMALIDETGE